MRLSSGQILWKFGNWCVNLLCLTWPSKSDKILSRHGPFWNKHFHASFVYCTPIFYNGLDPKKNGGTQKYQKDYKIRAGNAVRKRQIEEEVQQVIRSWLSENTHKKSTTVQKFSPLTLKNQKDFSPRPRVSQNFSQFSRIWPEFTQNLPSIFLEFTQTLHRIHTEFTQNSHRFTQNSHRIHSQFTQNLFRIYPQFIHNLSTIYSQFIHNLFTIYPQFIHNLSTIYPQFIHNLPRILPESAPYSENVTLYSVIATTALVK